LWEVFTTLWRFCVFVTDSKIHQTLNFYLKSTKANRLAKVIRVLSGKFTESSTTLLHWARLRRLHKCIQNTHRKLVLTKVNVGSKFVFKTDLYFIRRSAQIHWITSLSSRSITRSATARRSKTFAVTLSQIISSFWLAVDFWEVQ